MLMKLALAKTMQLWLWRKSRELSVYNIFINYLTSLCSDHTSVVAGPSSGTVYLEDIESKL